MKIFGNKILCESQCEALQSVLKNCCKHKPNIKCDDQKNFEVKCKICGKFVKSVSPTEILLKWNNFKKEKDI